MSYQLKCDHCGKPILDVEKHWSIDIDTYLCSNIDRRAQDEPTVSYHFHLNCDQLIVTLQKLIDQ